MPSINDIYSGDYLKAADILGKTVPVRINGFSVKEFENNGKVERKLVLAFEGKGKTLVVNKTNASIISSNIGTDDYSQWVGKTITLTTRKVESRGQVVDAIRVQLCEVAAAPAPKPEPITKTDPDVPLDDDGSVPF